MTRTLRNNRNRDARPAIARHLIQSALPRKHKTKTKESGTAANQKKPETKVGLPAAGYARRPFHSQGIKKKERKDQEPKNQKTRVIHPTFRQGRSRSEKDRGA
ncbi:hypothetical protein [Paracoccus simplex]|uniref:Uncharacterized protein n=1 Tax=Paracoccus simplex TaxID=2086346 RepID=A0ABV7RTI8_9RHOB